MKKISVNLVLILTLTLNADSRFGPGPNILEFIHRPLLRHLHSYRSPSKRGQTRIMYISPLAVHLRQVTAQLLSRVQPFVTPQTVAHQDPLSMGFPRQEYWSGLPFPPPENVSDPGVEPKSPVSSSPVVYIAGRFLTH